MKSLQITSFGDSVPALYSDSERLPCKRRKQPAVEDAATRLVCSRPGGGAAAGPPAAGPPAPAAAASSPSPAWSGCPAEMYTLYKMIIFIIDLVLVRPSGEVGQHLVDRAVRQILVDAVAGLAEGERELVAHPQQLPETDHLHSQLAVMLSDG